MPRPKKTEHNKQRNPWLTPKMVKILLSALGAVTLFLIVRWDQTASKKSECFRKVVSELQGIPKQCDNITHSMSEFLFSENHSDSWKKLDQSLLSYDHSIRTTASRFQEFTCYADENPRFDLILSQIDLTRDTIARDEKPDISQLLALSQDLANDTSVPPKCCSRWSYFIGRQ